jgi:Flp pilus assembly protein TadG
MVRKTVVIVLVIALVAVVANDVFRYAQAQQRLRDTTYDLARWAAENAPSASREAIANNLVTQAGPAGVTVTMYGQTDTGVQVWTQAEVPGLIVAGGLVNLMQGVPLNRALSDPVKIKDYLEAGIR